MQIQCLTLKEREYLSVHSDHFRIYFKLTLRMRYSLRYNYFINRNRKELILMDFYRIAIDYDFSFDLKLRLWSILRFLR